MKRFWVGGAALAFLVLPGGVVRAQSSSLDALDEELKEVAQQHSDATTQSLTNFFSQVDQAMGNPDAAVALWQQAGGAMPPPTPVVTLHENESTSERDARLAQDKANADVLGGVLMVHCGLLHYAAIFVTDANRKGLQDDFNAWLQKAAQSYPQLGSGVAPAGAGDANGEHHHHHDPGAGGGAPFDLGAIKGKSMHDSVISQFLGFKVWGEKEQAAWAVKDIPRLFKANILDPARVTPSQATLDAWDIYIAMEQADQPDTDKWTSTDYPPLQFERACDDYAITPGTDKLEVLVQIIHANPTHPQADDWLKRTKQLLEAYRAKRSGSPAAVAQNNAPPAAVTNSNVIITTVQQGDAQVITTHTNATPNPAPPQ